jgi:ADP-dependent NAD(P)H-hydrate dehydratase / NAD(P)H-hydrate epimerase
MDSVENDTCPTFERSGDNLPWTTSTESCSPQPPCDQRPLPSNDTFSKPVKRHQDSSNLRSFFHCSMRRIALDRYEPLYSVESTRALEKDAAMQAPAHMLMERAGHATAQLALALAPHAQTLWVACGPGNNGGDGLVAATHLQRQGQLSGNPRRICLTLAGNPEQLPTDATWALQTALASGLQISEQPPAQFDLAIDALLGIGAARQPQGLLAQHLMSLRQAKVPILSVDVPSGLLADTGALLGPGPSPAGERHTLSLLTLKPGLFTAQGRDAAGDIWFDDLGVVPGPDHPPTSVLNGWSPLAWQTHKRHTTHKGHRGEVLVVGGQGMAINGSGMVGAAVLAARAALRTGAGRVYLSLLDGSVGAISMDPEQPELMSRTTMAALEGDLLERCVVVCGCGGGETIGPMLPVLLARAQCLVLDADALNAIASDAQLQGLLKERENRNQTTVATPHPLEAARLLGITTTEVMANRMQAATALSDRLGVVCVLKGSGTVIAAPGQITRINGSGNAALATAGTGDVLAGMLGSAFARLTTGTPPLVCAAQTVFHHGWLADQWVHHNGTRPLTADWLTRWH